jgi:hypothetical protein
MGLHMITVKSSAELREELAQLRGRYDSGAVSPAVYKVIRALEADVAWAEHQERVQR